MNVSGCIIAFNEEKCIEGAIRSLKKISLIDEIIVVDGGSTDNTVKICEDLGCRVVINPWPNDFSIQRNFALDMCKNEWVCVLDADERYSENTCNILNKILKTPPKRVAAIYINELSTIVYEGEELILDIADVERHYPDYSTIVNDHTSLVPVRFNVGDDTVILTYSGRILNKFRGRWKNRVHEVFVANSEYVVTSLPKEYLIYHPKKMEKQYISNARYKALINEECLYSKTYDDMNNGTSIQSVSMLDNIFVECITKNFPCDWFIEAGAFDGQMSRLVSTILPNCKIHAFEANPYNYQHFKPLFENTNINYTHLALSGEKGTATFKIHTQIGDVIIPKIKGNDSLLSRATENVVYEDVTVSTTTLDDYFSDKEIQSSVAIWLDLEGVAYDVLQSASDVLKNVDIMKIEVESYPAWKGQKLDTDIKILLSHYGFFPIIRDYEYPNQYNILFCKQRILDSPIFRQMLTEKGFLYRWD